MDDDRTVNAALDPEIDVRGDTPPPLGDERLGPWLWQHFETARRRKAALNVTERWLRNHELYRGRHWRNRGKYALMPLNLIFNAVKLTVANLTDQDPRANVMCHEQGGEEQAQTMDKANRYWWRTNDGRTKLKQAVQKSETYGSVIGKMFFNPDIDEPLGDADFQIVDPLAFFPWPGKTDINDMPCVFEAYVMELSEIRRRWPDGGPKVSADPEMTELGGSRERVQGGLDVDADVTTSNVGSDYAVIEDQDDTDMGTRRALVIEAWFRDYSTRTVKVDTGRTQPRLNGEGLFVIDPLSGQIVQEPVYENQEIDAYPGNVRRVIMANNGRVILDDRGNPSINPELPGELASQTFLWNQYPYRKLDSNSDDFGFWGFSMIEQVEPLVMEINKKISQIVAHIDRTALPTLINPSNSGVPYGHVTNKPGQQWNPTNANTGMGIRYLDMPNLPSDFYKVIEMLLDLFDVITGIHEVSEGKKPGGVTAFRAIVALQEKAQTVFREKIHNLETFIEWVGRAYIGLVQNWYQVTRQITLSGQPEPEKAVFRGVDLQGKYEYEIVAGSTLPVNREYRRQEAVELGARGLIDQQAVLEALDFPNRDEVVHRMQAGPIGMTLEKIAALAEAHGVPRDFVQNILGLAQVPDEEAKKIIAQARAQQQGPSNGQGGPQPKGPVAAGPNVQRPGPGIPPNQVPGRA